MSAGRTPTVLDIIRTAAADCGTQGNTMAQNELLGAAVTVYNMLDALQATADNIRSIAASGPYQYFYGPWVDEVDAAIARASGVTAIARASQTEGGAV